MKILFLALEPPYPPNDGGRIRTFNILKQVAARHAVTLVAFSGLEADEALAALRLYCHDVIAVPRPVLPARHWAGKVRDLPRRYPPCLAQYRSEVVREKLRHLLAEGSFDVVHVDQIFLAQYADVLASLPAVLTHHNVEAEIQRRQLRLRHAWLSRWWWAAWLDEKRWGRFEVDASRCFDAVVVVSRQDAAYFAARVPGVPIVYVPNGVDAAHFCPGPARDNGAALLFAGRMDYAPNIDGACWFCRDILPLVRRACPEVTLTIVGRDPVPEVQMLANLPGVTVTGTVPDVRPYYAQASVYVVPLRYGGGTRLKILEAMAMSMPIVSTSLGCEGLEISPGEDLLVADRAENLASAVVHLLGAPAVRSRLSSRARQTAEARFDWSAISEEQERAYQAAITRWIAR